VPYHLALAATGGRAPYKWSADGLPSGFTLDASTGVITGTPGAVTTAAVKVTVTDALGLTNTIDVNLPVEAKLAIKKATLPQGRVGGTYSARLGTLGGVGPFKWAVTGLNTLPAGIKLNARTGRLYGVPKRAGTYRFRVQVTDALGVHSSLSFVLKVTGGARR
jgi:hypothetical protein